MITKQEYDDIYTFMKNEGNLTSQAIITRLLDEVSERETALSYYRLSSEVQEYLKDVEVQCNMESLISDGKIEDLEDIRTVKVNLQSLLEDGLDLSSKLVYMSSKYSYEKMLKQVEDTVYQIKDSLLPSVEMAERSFDNEFEYCDQDIEMEF